VSKALLKSMYAMVTDFLFCIAKVQSFAASIRDIIQNTVTVDAVTLLLYHSLYPDPSAHPYYVYFVVDIKAIMVKLCQKVSGVRIFWSLSVLAVIKWSNFRGQ